MPRISPGLLRTACAINPLLPHLLLVCRDLRSAQNELRWLEEYAGQKAKWGGRPGNGKLLRWCVSRRARGEPLQYILGSEYFGDLEIKCRPGVLIPRQETAASVTYLVHRLQSLDTGTISQGGLRVLDLCTGTGCIPLLFHHEFYSRPKFREMELELVAVDVSSKAIELAQTNKRIQLDANGDMGSTTGLCRLQSLRNLHLMQADVMLDASHSLRAGARPILEALQQEPGVLASEGKLSVDILVSNPPYISSQAYKFTTSRLVRLFEPRLALVPSTREASAAHDGDVFYPRLLDLARRLEARVVLLEVADLDQAQRVALLAVQQRVWDVIEIWRDDPSVRSAVPQNITLNGKKVNLRGVGQGRSVFAYRSLTP